MQPPRQAPARQHSVTGKVCNGAKTNPLAATASRRHNSCEPSLANHAKVTCVLLQQPEPTSADLRFRLLGVYVRVHPLFWLMSAILGWRYMAENPQQGFIYLAIWILCVF